MTGVAFYLKIDFWIWFATLVPILFIPRFFCDFFLCGEPKTFRPASGRDPGVDALRGAATLAVVAIHAAYLVILRGGLDLGEWSNLVLVNNCARFAVPTFIFLSGFCLEKWPDTKLGVASFYSRKVKRIFVPYIIVSLLLSYLGGKTFEGCLWDLLTGGASIPFYFMVVLAQLYVLYPLLSAWVSFSPRAAVILSLLISSATVWTGFGQTLFGIPLPFSLLFLFVLGMVSPWPRRLTEERTPPSFILPIIILYLSGNAAAVCYLFFVDNSAGLSWFTDNFQYFYSFSVALALLSVFRRFSIFEWSLGSLGQAGLWVYLLHFPLQEYLTSSIRGFDLGYLGAFSLIFSVPVLAGFLTSVVVRAFRSGRA